MMDEFRGPISQVVPLISTKIQLSISYSMKFVLLTLISVILRILVIPSLVFAVEDTSSISQSQPLSHEKTIVSSPLGTFVLGFFNLGNPNKIYLGIWYKNIPFRNVVWVANGANPINDSSCILKLSSSGNLVLTHNDMVVWCTSSPEESQNPVAVLLDSGNLVIRDQNAVNQEEYMWQSFDYPSNTMVAGMKIGWDQNRNLNKRLIAWKNDDDPTPGDLTWGVTLNPYPEMYIMKGTKKYHRVGPWNGLRFSGRPQMKDNRIYNYEFVSNKKEVYFTWTLKNTSVVTIAVVNQTTLERPRYVWSDTDKAWNHYSTMPEDYCDHYGVCGSNAYCSTYASPMCACLKGFEPKSPENWTSTDWSQGCVLKHPLNCKNDGFVLVEGLKVPDTKDTSVDESINLEQCKTKCLNYCSCMAYTNSDIRGAGSGCVMWFGDLFDIKQYPAPENGQGLYIRLPASELGKSKPENRCETYVDDLDLPLIDLSIITAATDNFSDVNKIGEGGFGPVYWGKLASGLEIAVKRLSQNSGQGITEFLNEVKLIAKLQHRNLVKLLGCCIQKQEKILVYEYMSNGSLDYFIFDFGLAKTVGREEVEGNTNKIVGTFGYMAPEYAVDGQFSVKSDVFSFGVLLLEIIYGKKNRGRYHGKQYNLVDHGRHSTNRGKKINRGKGNNTSGDRGKRGNGAGTRCSQIPFSFSFGTPHHPHPHPHPHHHLDSPHDTLSGYSPAPDPKSVPLAYFTQPRLILPVHPLARPSLTLSPATAWHPPSHRTTPSPLGPIPTTSLPRLHRQRPQNPSPAVSLSVLVLLAVAPLDRGPL
ncbi:unnamed protein product [Sphenostylis stenocarpa]|uniref:Receptor-like serine/threonine-protein kinase n=1 Tax=Sphenostylis stenocarpa TaxID=92480 RepID=A0AA86W4X4_9FABA|nr:unnamed protein product [Sphenostylis stenocarpa]